MLVPSPYKPDFLLTISGGGKVYSKTVFELALRKIWAPESILVANINVLFG